MAVRCRCASAAHISVSSNTQHRHHHHLHLYPAIIMCKFVVLQKKSLSDEFPSKQQLSRVNENVATTNNADVQTKKNKEIYIF